MQPRRLILSRKGFDGGETAGGTASPVFPDGSMLSLPIPAYQSPTLYGDLRFNGLNVGDVVHDLTDGRYGRDSYAHLGPDINWGLIRKRGVGWRGLTGQANPSASGHLLNEGVGIGDLFLFFGLFRHVEQVDGAWDYARGSTPFHALWGWLQIGGVHFRDDLNDRDFPWARDFPTLHQEPNPLNLLFVASLDLDLGNGVDEKGFGIFGALDDRLLLTREGGTASQWRLPRWFARRLSNMGEFPWRARGDWADVDRPGFGQEFVIDLAALPDDERRRAGRWLRMLFAG